MLKQILISIVFVAIGAAGAIYYMNQQGHVHGKEYCTEHSIAEAQCRAKCKAGDLPEGEEPK